MGNSLFDRFKFSRCWAFYSRHGVTKAVVISSCKRGMPNITASRVLLLLRPTRDWDGDDVNSIGSDALKTKIRRSRRMPNVVHRCAVRLRGRAHGSSAIAAKLGLRWALKSAAECATDEMTDMSKERVGKEKT